MFKWLRKLIGKNGDTSGAKIKRDNLDTESRKMIIDLKRLNEELVEAMKPRGETSHQELHDGCL